MEKDISEEIINLSGSLQSANNSHIREQIIALINTLINKDFHSLLQLLYKIDVNENTIRSSLKNDSNTMAADVIAESDNRKAMSKNRKPENF